VTTPADDDALRGAQARLDARRGGTDGARVVHRLRGRHTPTPGGDTTAAPARRAPPPVEDHEADADGSYPRVTPGEYDAVLVAAHQHEQWGRWRWLLTLRILEPGPAHGVELPYYLPRPPADSRPRRAWAMTAAYIVSTGRRPPRNLARLHPSVYLGGERVLRVRVVDVERDYLGRPVPEGARYSRVRAVLGVATGGGPRP
jgi:hypothetical protein